MDDVADIPALKFQKNMKIVLNISHAKKGGAKTVASYYIENLNVISDAFDSVVLLTNRSFSLNARGKNINIFRLPLSPLLRIPYELFLGLYLFFMGYRIVWNIFGFLAAPGFRQVTTFADSNLTLSKNDFWKGSILYRFSGFSKDLWRMFNYSRMWIIFLENDSFLEWAQSKLTDAHIHFVRPAHVRPLNKLCKRDIDVLFLGSLNPNKNEKDFFNLALTCQKAGRQLTFVCVTPKKKELSRLATKLNLRIVQFIDPCYGKDLHKLYRRTRFTAILSKIESFTNTLPEAISFASSVLMLERQWTKSYENLDGVFVGSLNELCEKVLGDSLIEANFETTLSKLVQSPEKKIFEEIKLIKSHV